MKSKTKPSQRQIEPRNPMRCKIQRGKKTYLIHSHTHHNYSNVNRKKTQVRSLNIVTQLTRKSRQNFLKLTTNSFQKKKS